MRQAHTKSSGRTGIALILAGLAWLIGLWAGLALGAPPSILWPAVLAAVGAIAAPAPSWLRLIGLAAAAALFGAWRAALVVPGLGEGPLTQFRDEVVTLRGHVAGSPRCSPTSCLFVLEVQQVQSASHSQELTGQVQIRTHPGIELTYGHSALVRGRLQTPRAVLGFPRVELLRRQGIYEVMSYPAVRLGPAVEAQPRGRLEAIRGDLEQRLTGAVAGPEGQLAAGLLLGRDVALPPEVRTQLRETGTSHLLAVSGFNVALVGGVTLGLVGRLLARPWSMIVTTMVVVLYTLLVGAPPSAVRAALMFGAAALATTVGRLPDPLTSLVLAAALMTAIDPLLILDLGFQLSFAATAGIVLVAGRLTPGRGGPARYLAAALGLTLAAQLMTLPLVLHTFHNLSLVSPLTNVLVAPILLPLMGFGALALAASWTPELVGVLAAPAWLLGHAMLAVIGWTAQLPGAAMSTGGLPPWAVVAAYGCILAPLGLLHLGSRASPSGTTGLGRLSLALGLAGLVTVAGLASVRSAPAGQLRALFLDVAGDGLTLVETPSGRRLLIGSAGSPLAASALAEQLPLLDRTIDLLVVTRAGARDIDGLIEIARRYPANLVLQPGGGKGEAWSRWTSTLAERSIPAITASHGLSVEIEDGAWLEVESVIDEDAERSPSLNARILFGSLDLHVVGGARAVEIDGQRTTVVRLAPQIGLRADLLAQLVGERSVVVGGRGSTSSETAVVHFRLFGDDVVELTSDGGETRIRRSRCPAGAAPCSWP